MCITRRRKTDGRLPVMRILHGIGIHSNRLGDEVVFQGQSLWTAHERPPAAV